MKQEFEYLRAVYITLGPSILYKYVLVRRFKLVK